MLMMKDMSMMMEEVGRVVEQMLMRLDNCMNTLQDKTPEQTEVPLTLEHPLENLTSMTRNILTNNILTENI